MKLILLMPLSVMLPEYYKLVINQSTLLFGHAYIFINISTLLSRTTNIYQYL